VGLNLFYTAVHPRRQFWTSNVISVYLRPFYWTLKIYYSKIPAGISFVCFSFFQVLYGYISASFKFSIRTVNNFFIAMASIIIFLSLKRFMNVHRMNCKQTLPFLINAVMLISCSQRKRCYCLIMDKKIAIYYSRPINLALSTIPGVRSFQGLKLHSPFLTDLLVSKLWKKTDYWNLKQKSLNARHIGLYINDLLFNKVLITYFY
jgi:hypothetical protein